MAKKSKTPSRKESNPVAAFNDVPLRKTLTFVGLVGYPGPSGMRSGQARKYTFSARLVAWKVAGDAVSLEKINVIDPRVADITLSNRMKQFASFSIVKFTARRSTKPYWGFPALQLARYLGPGQDAELQQVKTEMTKPIVLNDKVFGKVEFEPSSQSFVARNVPGPHDLNVIFESHTREEAERLLTLSKLFWKSRKKWFKEFQRVVLEDRFVDSAEWWDQNHQERLTKQTFLALLGDPCLVSFSINDGELSFHLSGYCDELFGDNGPDAYGTLAGGLHS